MGRIRPAAMTMPLVILAASQAGHLLAAELRRGPRGPALDGSGAHVYVPTLTTVSLGAAGLAVLVALLVVAAARLRRAAPVQAGRRLHRPSVLDVAAALFALQLAAFGVQETLEAAWAGGGLPSVGDLLLWGSLGQLPVALLAGVVASWLWARFEAAVEDLVASPPALPLAPWQRPARPRAQMPRPRPISPSSPTAGALGERAPPPFGAARLPSPSLSP